MPGNRVVSIFLSGADDSVDTVLGIYNESGSNLLGENDDADDDSRASVLTDLDVGAQAANFTLEVRVKNTNEIQQFTLKIVAVPREEDGAESGDALEESADG